MRTTLRKLAVFPLIAAMVLGSAAGAGGKKDKGGKKQAVEVPPTNDTISAFVRSNAEHYWHYMLAEADLDAIKDLMQYQGTAAGDPHMGNFAPMPVRRNGQDQMAFLDVDFDDAGEAPLILDFARYMVAVKAVFANIKKKDMEDAYMKGLAGESVAGPMQLQSVLDVTWDDYQKMASEYVAKKTEGGKFKYKTGEIEKYRANVEAASIEALFPGEKVLDLATRPQESGGSASGMRIWILVQGKDGNQRIMELKQYEPSALNSYREQAKPAKWLNAVRAAFWPGFDGSTYDLVNVDGTLFWLRQKQVSMIDVPYSSSKSSKLAYAEGLAIYDANQLGLAHGRQSIGAQYLAALERDEELHNKLEAIVNEYLTVANQARSPQGGVSNPECMKSLKQTQH